MGVDQAGQRNHAAAIDHLGARCGYIGADSDDRAAAHMHVAALKVADRSVHRQYARIAHDEFAAGRQVGARRCVC